MMNTFCWLFVNLLMLCKQKCFALNFTEYYQMPSLNQFDDYDRCLNEFVKPSKYCIVNAQIISNTSSDRWRIIEKFSADEKRHYRHDRLKLGICLNWCNDMLKEMDSIARKKFSVKDWNHTDELTDVYYTYFSNSLDDDIRYGKVVNQCVNYRFNLNYGLRTRTRIEYCDENVESVHSSTDWVDYGFILFCIIIFSTIASCSIFDIYQKSVLQTNEIFYKQSLNTKMKNFLACFSLPRNFYRLINDTDEEMSRDNNLRSIQALRVCATICVVFGHCAAIYSILPVYNPYIMEAILHKVTMMPFITGHIIVQTFFVISGFMLSFHFEMEKPRNVTLNFVYLIRLIIFRYIRLTPMYAFIIWFDSTWLLKVQDGPMWRHIAESEKEFCRKNFWTNLLYLNNAVNPDQPCLQQGWYLAADFQCFLCGVILLMVLHRFPNAGRPILVLLSIFAYTIPGLVVYINKFDGIFVVTPENAKYAHWLDIMYLRFYIPFYTNLGSYLCGISFGIFYAKIITKNIPFAHRKLLHVLWYASHPLAVAFLMIGNIFYSNDFVKPSFWIALYAIGFRTFWSVYSCIVIVGFCLGFGARQFACYPLFRVLGRLTYGVFLIHLIIIRLIQGNVRQPIYLSIIRLISDTTSTLVLSYLLALILALFIEFPISAMQKIYIENVFPKPNKSAKVEVDSIEKVSMENLNI